MKSLLLVFLCNEGLFLCRCANLRLCTTSVIPWLLVFLTHQSLVWCCLITRSCFTSRWVLNMAEVLHTNQDYKQFKSCYNPSVKCKTPPPFSRVRVSLLFSLATTQNLEWPTFIPTPIPPPIGSSNMHSAANALELNGDLKSEVDCPITRHTTPWWYELPFEIKGDAWASQIQKSHEATCLEYKQAENTQW